jgi:hypothetical protein
MPLKIHLIFKTHLDVGFTNYAAVVTQQYFSGYIPAAVTLARRMREKNEENRFIWTTGSWLIYEYLEQADTAGRRGMEDAIAAGEIAWHALPFTTHSELMDADLFRAGLSLSQRLDRRFGKQTIAAKFTDVPGHTRGIVPLLAEAGVQFLHIGVNPGSSVPAVPPLFRWQDPSGAEVVVMYESGYGSAFVLPNGKAALAFGHSIDNLGPQNEQEVDGIFEHLRKEFPDARVEASTLNEFAKELQQVRSGLPVVTQEIGDSWIHGAGSDPLKVAQFRELLRMRKAWLMDSPALKSDKRFDGFQRKLLLIPEHTWGMDEKTFLGDHEAYSAEKFSAARSMENFRTFEDSWAEQRGYIEAALAELGRTQRGFEARKRLLAQQPQRPDLTAWESMKDLSFELPLFSGRINAQTGAIGQLAIKPGGKQWADTDHPLGLLLYQTFSAADYERFFRQYIRPEEQNNGWSREDFTKPGLEKAQPLSRFWQPRVAGIYRKDNRLMVHLQGEPQAVSEYGCPRDFYLTYAFAEGDRQIEVELNWFDKPACRLPEALWLGFRPPVSANAEWRMDKLGEQVSPLEVVENGNRHLHAVGRGITCADGLRIDSLDAPLVAPGEPSLLDFNNQQPDLTKGMHFNLYNNLWGTNFPMWFEDDCRFRFRLIFS